VILNPSGELALSWLDFDLAVCWKWLPAMWHEFENSAVGRLELDGN
jgi:hypothetical protein